MKTYLVTGAAGFIGANYIKYLLHKKYVNEEIKVIVLDALTYAGNLGTIKDDIDISWINEELITHVPDRLGHDARYAIDPTKIKNELGWYPETMFADGIVKTIRWNLEHQDWIQEVTSGDYQKYYDMMYTKKGR